VDFFDGRYSFHIISVSHIISQGAVVLAVETKYRLSKHRVGREKMILHASDSIQELFVHASVGMLHVTVIYRCMLLI